MPIFSRAQRLVDKPQFDLVYQTGRKLSDRFFLLAIRPNQLPNARLGLSVSTRTVGNAVNRNRVKRIIRDSFRLHCQEFPGVDVVVNSRNLARDADNATLRNSLEKHWINVVKQCGTP